MTKENENKEKNKFVSPPTNPITPEDAKSLRDFTKTIFDPMLQEEFEEFLNGTVSVRGKKVAQEEERVSISLRELTTHENPAIANVTALYGVFNPETIPVTTYDLMKEDPTVSAGLAFIKLPIFALPWRIECDDEKIRTFVEDALKRIWRRLVRSMLTAVEYGFSSHEKIFEIKEIKVEKKKPDGKQVTHFSGRALLYKKFKSHHPDSIKVNLDKKGNFNGIVQTQSLNNEVEVKKYKCFFFTHDEEFGNIFGKSRLKPAYKYWYWKEIVYNFMLMYYERRGSPPIIVTAPTGSSKSPSGARIDNLQSGLDVGSSLQSNSVAVLPFEETKSGSDNKWRIEYLSDDKRGEMFISAIDHLDTAILRALWIPERAITQGGSGSYSMASVHADLFLMAELGLVNDIEAAIDEQIIPLLIQANFKPEERRPCYFRMDSMDWNRKISLKEIFIEMMRNVDNMVQAGYKPRRLPSIEQMAKILQIPVESFDLEVETPEPEEKEENKNEVIPDNVVDIKGNPLMRQRKTSFTGSRESDRRDLRPGGKRAEQIRAKMQELFDDVHDIGGVEEVFAPAPDEQGNIPVVERLRYQMIIKAQTPEGLHDIKKGLARLKVFSGGMELIQNFDLMGFWEVVRSLHILPAHYVELLNEAMNRQLSEDK